MTLTSEPILDEKTFCAVHPDVETGLKCAKCGRYMCSKCAVLTEVGYKCRQCIYNQQDAFFKATQRDHLLAAAVATGIGLVAGFIVPRTFVIGALFLGPATGALVGWAVLRVCQNRRGRRFPLIAAAALVITALVTNLALLEAIIDSFTVISRIANGGELAGVVLQAALPLVIYGVTSVLVASSRLR